MRTLGASHGNGERGKLKLILILKRKIKLRGIFFPGAISLGRLEAGTSKLFILRG